MKALSFFIFLLLASFFTVNAQEEFSMIIMSDPQFPWTLAQDKREDPDDEKVKAESRRLNKQHVNSANSIMSSIGNVKGVIINGDLTAYGHAWQLDEFEEIYRELEVPMYLGLGNHDYANGVDKCYENACANRMVKFMRDHVQRANIPNFDFHQSDSYEFPEMVRTIEGSLSYSWDIGNVHFVQCHNFPIYERNWSSFVSGEAKRYSIDIQNSLEWLRNDLAKARRAGKIIILNFHDPEQHWRDAGALRPNDTLLTSEEKKIINSSAPFMRESLIESYTPHFEKLIHRGFKHYKDNLIEEFRAMLEKYKVSAVFVGHYHGSLGKQEVNKDIYGSVPVFFCGSASQSKYLLVHFKGNEMTVEKVFSNKKESERRELDPRTYELYNQPEAVPIPRRDSKITFFNEGGYVARYALSYKLDGKWKHFETGKLLLGNKKSYNIPGKATEITVLGQSDAVFEWNTIFRKELQEIPERICFKTYGTVFSPEWDNNCE